MTTVAKTAVTSDKSELVDGDLYEANATDVTTPLIDLEDYIKAGHMSVSANDTHLGTLIEKLVVSGDGIVRSEQNDGADETLQLNLSTKLEALNALLTSLGKVGASAMDSTGVPSGYIPRANGSGGVSYGAEGGGGAQPIDLTGTAGEALSERDMVFLDESDGQWYKMDIDATGSILAGKWRGCVNESGGILSAANGSIRILGEVSGFTGLTAWNRVYANTSPGGYTQTKPSVTDGGGQIAVAEIGMAVSTTAILIKPEPISYIKRKTLANNATMTVEHHSDPKSRQREIRAYVGTTVAGSSLATYASGNQDDSVLLRRAALGGSTTSQSSDNVDALVGNNGSFDRAQAQGFQLTVGGELSEITVKFGANTGSPSGTVTWTIETDSAGSPSGVVLSTGTFTPTASAINTITPSGGVILSASTQYWLTIRATAPQASGVGWNLRIDTTGSGYTGGTRWFSGDNGTTWSNEDVTNFLYFSVTADATTVKDKLSQSFQVTGAQTLGSVNLWLKKVGSPTDTMTLRIETDSAGSPSGTLVDANATTTVSESTLSTSYGDILFTFASSFSISGSTTYWLVLSTDRSASGTDYVEWGADSSSPSYANGEMKSEASSTWSAESADAIFEVFAEGTQYDEPCVIGRWSGGTRDCAVRFDDGSGSNGNTQTTFKNVTGGSLDFVCEVEVA